MRRNGTAAAVPCHGRWNPSASTKYSFPRLLTIRLLSPPPARSLALDGEHYCVMGEREAELHVEWPFLFLPLTLRNGMEGVEGEGFPACNKQQQPLQQRWRTDGEAREAQNGQSGNEHQSVFSLPPFVDATNSDCCTPSRK